MNNFNYLHKILLSTISTILLGTSIPLISQDLNSRFCGDQGLMQWIGRDSASVIDYVLPLNTKLGAMTNKIYDPGARIIFWRLDVRNLSIEPSGVEFQFSILGCRKGDTIAILRYPLNESIDKQEQELKKEYPRATNREIAEHIKVVCDTIIVADSKELLERISTLKSIGIPLLTNSSEGYYPNYQIYSKNMAGQAYLFLAKEAVENEENGRRLLQWIDDMFALLKRISELKGK
jgi:hypothetical protein